MSRFVVWVLCCATVFISLMLMRGDVDTRVLLSIFSFLGAPLMLHWAFASEKATKDVEERK